MPQTMPYHIMELCVMTIVASLLHTICLCVVTDIDNLQLRQNLPNSHWIAIATYSHAYSQRYNSGSSSHFFLHNTSHRLITYSVKKNTVA